MPNQNAGTSTAGDRLKSAHRKVLATNTKVSLKVFAQQLIQQGRKEKSDVGKDAQDWMDAKEGALNLKRSDKNVSRIAEEKRSSKATVSKK